MPIELAVWRVDGALTRIQPAKLDLERRLEDFIHHDIGLVREDLWLIGRQVPTGHGHFIDLLAIDVSGNITVLELKRDKTPRDVVAQALDYGLWVRDLARDTIAGIYESYARKYLPLDKQVPLDVAFNAKFGHPLPETVNETHELLIVATELDDATERIIEYLAEWDVPVNAVFFRTFKDGDREYLTRAWLRDPTEAKEKTEEAQARKRGQEPWNGNDFYVSFGHGNSRDWDDARKYGFVSAGGGAWFTRTMRQLQVGNRLFVYVPERGYVGVGRVTETARRADQFEVIGGNGTRTLLTPAMVVAKDMFHDRGSDDLAENLVRVDWIKGLPLDQAYREKGLFANQNSACKLRSKFTIDRLTKVFGLAEQTT